MVQRNKFIFIKQPELWLIIGLTQSIHMTLHLTQQLSGSYLS